MVSVAAIARLAFCSACRALDDFCTHVAVLLHKVAQPLSQMRRRKGRRERKKVQSKHNVHRRK